MSIIEQIAGLVSGKIDIAKSVAKIIKLETKLAALSVYPLILNLCVMLIVLMSLWLSSMVLVGYCLNYVLHNTFLALGIVVLINIGLLTILHQVLLLNLRKMSFEKTREYFSHKVEDEYNGLTTTDQRRAEDDGQTIKIPTD